MSKNKSKFSRLIKAVFADNAYCWLSFLCTALIMMLVYFCYELFPFGEVTILRMDLYHQYGPLFAELYDRVTDFKSLIYSWSTGLGGPFLGNYFNYLASPTVIFMLLFGHKNMPEAIAAMILTKAAFASASFTFYLKKSQQRHDFTTSAFGILYAMCGYFVAYYWNVMWLDCMVYFPLVIYGIERIINKRKPSVYIAFLALTLLSNYYMGYMTCIFSVIYFFVYYFSTYDVTALSDHTVYFLDGEGKKQYTTKERIKGSVLLRSGITFGFSSAAAGCLVAFALIPTYIILKSCSATSGVFPQDYKIYFSIFDFLANHLASVDPTIRSSGEDVLPNVYCGMGTLILVPLYLFSKRFSLREKVAGIFTLGIIYFSFNLNYLNYIWHGFHFPNDLPYRFSFMYCFILLVMAYKAFRNLDEYSGRQILGAGVAVIIMIVLVQKIGSKNVEDITILLSIIFTVTYCLVFYLLKDIKKQKSAIAVILLCCVIAEIACSNTDRYSMSQTKTSYTSDYTAFRKVKSMLDELENGDDSYRMEITYNRARMDPAWFGYNGISTFSSMAYERMANMQSNLGVYSNYINSYTYYLQTPVYNMMHSLKYIVNNDTTVDVTDDYYENVACVDKFTAYKNDYYLNIATAVSSDLKEWYSEYTNPFETQASWFELSTGVADIFGMMDITPVSYSNVNKITSGLDSGDIYYSKAGAGEGSMVLGLSTEETRHCYLFVDSENFDEITVSVNGDTKVQSIDEAYILDIGVINPGDDVEVTITLDEESSEYGSMNFYPYYVDDEKLDEGYAILKANQMNIESFDETCIKGSISTDKDCLMYTSIPYDEGWTVKIDGQEISEDDYVSLEDAYLCFNLPAGDHEIEISFTQRGLKEGLAISAVTILLLIAVAFVFKKKRPEWDRAYEQKCEQAQADYENMKAEAERIRQMELNLDEIPIDEITGDENDADTASEEASEAVNEETGETVENASEEPEQAENEEIPEETDDSSEDETDELINEIPQEETEPEAAEEKTEE